MTNGEKLNALLAIGPPTGISQAKYDKIIALTSQCPEFLDQIFDSYDPGPPFVVTSRSPTITTWTFDPDDPSKHITKTEA